MSRFEKHWKTGSRLSVLPLESRSWLNAGSTSCTAETLRLGYSTCEMGIVVAATWELALRIAAHSNTHKMILFCLPGSEPFLTPLLHFPASHMVTFTKTTTGLGSNWLSCLYLDLRRRTLSWKRLGTDINTISMRPKTKAPESDLGLNPHSAPYLLAVWPQTS